MIKIIKGGDILQAKETIIAHQINCQGVMGGGVALAIRNNYPDHYKDFMKDDRAPEKKLGTIVKSIISPEKIVVGLYGQLYFGGSPNVVYTDYDALEKAIVTMIHTTSAYDYALPFFMGSDLAGGDWNVIYKMLTNISEEYHINFFLYDLFNKSGI